MITIILFLIVLAFALRPTQVQAQTYYPSTITFNSPGPNDTIWRKAGVMDSLFTRIAGVMTYIYNEGVREYLAWWQIQEKPGMNNAAAYSSGTAYTLTTSSAKVDFGTTDPAIVLPAAGTYLIYTNIKIEYSGVTTALNACAFKLRRVNNTAADLPNGNTSFNVPALTLASGTGGDVDIPVIIYTTTNSNDAIELWGNRSGGLTLGGINVGEASIVAIRIY